MTSLSPSPIEAQKDALLGAGTPLPPQASRPRFAAANSLATALVLSLSAGYLDGFTFVGHGGGFASAMTGNMLLFGINLAARSPQAFANFYPLVAYVMGAFAANCLMRAPIRQRLPCSPHFMTLLLEIAVLIGVAFLPPTIEDHLLVAIVTLSTAMQNTTFRNIGKRTYNSTIMTGNLQSFASGLAVGVFPGDSAAWEQVGTLGAVLLSFMIGAVTGAAATPVFGNHVTLAPAALLGVLAIALALSSEDESLFQKA